MYPNPVQLVGDNLVQTCHNVFAQQCSFPECKVTVMYYNAGQQGATECFEVPGCDCDYPTLCCTLHVNEHTCPDCEKSEEPSPASSHVPQIKRTKT